MEESDQNHNSRPLNKALMTETTTRDSTKFPLGYGDFILQCSDGVVCHFPRHLLEYMSPVFKDMFIVSNHNSTSSSQSLPLILVERSEVIELLLEHIDPRSMQVPPIDPKNILGLLEAARKYQVIIITERFKEQAALRQVNTTTGDIKEPFTSTHPDLALQCAVRFDFPHIGRLALRELVRGPPPEPWLEGDHMPVLMYKHLCQLREARIKVYRVYIDVFASTFSTGFSPSCKDCPKSGTNWILRMDRAVSLHPRWQTFFDAYKTEDKCDDIRCIRRSWHGYYSGVSTQWEIFIIERENDLPEWPL